MSNLAQEIAKIRADLGDDVCIVGHHYQADDIIAHCDITGDSLELARKIPQVTAPHIVFCGVYFMAESAALLAREGQKIYIPDSSANCVMSQMAPAPLLESVFQALSKQNGTKIIPLAYVNTALAIKDVVGRYGGAVCTSANAEIMLKWALNQGDQVLFLPDKNLAQNTARKLGLEAKDEHVLNVRANGTQIDAKFAKAKLLMWPGCCAVHAKFNADIIQKMRATYNNCYVYVHPECSPQVVENSDGAGSTSYLIDIVAKSPKGSTVIVGTEANLVYRLQKRHANHCKIVPLRNSYCSHMAKISAEKLFANLQQIKDGKAQAVKIPSNQVKTSRATLERMLDACAKAGV